MCCWRVHNGCLSHFSFGNEKERRRRKIKNKKKNESKSGFFTKPQSFSPSRLSFFFDGLLELS
jgi:hypothetical protein